MAIPRVTSARHENFSTPSPWKTQWKVSSVKARFPFWHPGGNFTVFFTHTLFGFCFYSKQAKGRRGETIRLSDFVSRKKVLLLSPENPQREEAKGNLHRWDEREGRRALLNIIEKTCCINDFPRLSSHRCCFLIYYFWQSAKGSTDNSELRQCRVARAKLCLRDLLWWWALAGCSIRKFACLLVDYANLITAVYYF